MRTVIWTSRLGFWKEQQAVLLTVCNRGPQTNDNNILPRLYGGRADCKKCGHIPGQLEDADQPSTGHPMTLSGLQQGPGKQFAVVCNACIKAKKSAKKCKDLGHQEPPEEAGIVT